MKQWIQAIQSGTNAAWKQWRLSLGLYLFTLLIGLVLVLPVRSFLLQQAGHSQLLDELQNGINYTFLNDMQVAYGVGWLPNVGQVLLLIMLYLLGWTFFTGGIIRALSVESSKESFWANCRTYCSRLLLLNVPFWLMQLLVIGVFACLHYQLASGFSPARLDSETIIFASIPWVWGTYIFVAMCVRLWQMLSQVVWVKGEKDRLSQVVKGASRYFRTHFWGLLGMSLLFLLLLVLSYLIFHALRQSIHVEKENWGLVLLFLLTQVWVWGRVFLKLSLWGGVMAFTFGKD